MAHYTATLVVGIIASVTSLGLIISRVLVIGSIRKQNTIEKLHPYACLSCFSSYIFWSSYSTALLFSTESHNKGTPPHELRLQFLLYVNHIGMAFELLYILNFLVVIVGKSVIFGPIAVVFGIIMYCSPLFVIRNVYKTKRVGCFSFLFCLASLLNGIVWFIYAFFPTIDLYLAIANGIGILLGIVQLGLLYMFREKLKFVDAQLEDVEIL
ncbi:hypothetical protein ACJIZ3_009128 [Penstemon smallii]|uniref:Bidirectional sugar transporter SWEET n=1 Tax=Penstemon smallii TaxID=265156 RepID=A0ABD3TBM7_9LAMI